MAIVQQITLFLIVITGLAVTCYLFYQQSGKRSNKQLNNETEENEDSTMMMTIENDNKQNTNNSSSKTIEAKKDVVINKKPSLNPRFPQCYLESIKYTALSEILYELHLNSNSCVGANCFNSNKNKNNHRTKNTITSKETTGLIVTYLAVGVLFIGLAAAFLEVVKAKQEIKVQSKKPELTRRCSLAELNVLRHNRMEMMTRRDSTITEESTKRVPLGTIGRKSSRPRLRVT